MKKNISKKIMAVLLLGTIACAPLRSQAVFGIGDFTFDAGNFGEAVANVLLQVSQYTGQVKELLKTFGLDQLAYNLAQKASQKLVAKVLNKVNGGATQSAPQNFVVNFGKYFDDISGKEVSKYTSELYGSKNPFAVQLSIGITNSTSGYTSNGLESFTLGKVIDGNWQGATQDISTAGNKGWNFYSQLAFPQNTPIGAGFIAQQQLADRQAYAAGVAKLELTSPGFKPQKAKDSGYAILGGLTGINFNALESGIKGAEKNVCGSKNGSFVSSLSSTDPGLCKTGSVSGFTAGDHIWNWSCHSAGNNGKTKVDAECSAGSNLPTEPDAACGPANGEAFDNLASDSADLCMSGSVVGFSKSSTNGSWNWSCHSTSFNAPDAECNADSTGYGAGMDNSSPNANEDFTNVETDKDVETPSSTVDSNVAAAGQEASKRLQNADEFFKLIFSTLSQMATGLIEKGLSSLISNAGQASKNQYGSPSDLPSLNNAKGSSWVASPEQIIDFRNELGVAYEKTTLDVKYNTQLLELTKLPVTGKILDSGQIAAGAPESDGMDNVLQKLELCIPGPDTGWENRFNQYVNEQVKATQARTASDGTEGENNSKVYKLIMRVADTALQEERERVDNPLLNMPGTSELRTIAASYYQNTKQFQTVFTKLLVKRSTASQLATIVAQVKAFTPDLTLFDDQWNALSTAQQAALYAALQQKLLDNFTGDYGDPNDPAKLTPLPADDPATPDINEHTDEMKNRVLAEEWREWETETVRITNTQRQNIYKKFAAIQQNITDAKSLQDTKNSLDAVVAANTELADALHDCMAIRDATVHYDQYPTDADWDTFKKTKLLSQRIKLNFTPGTSIIGLAKGTINTDLHAEGEITLPVDIDGEGVNDPADLAMNVKPTSESGYTPVNAARATPYIHWVEQHNINQLQVQPVVPLANDADRKINFAALRYGSNDTEIGVPNTPPGTLISSFFREDNDGSLFCRLPGYALTYWLPHEITGFPIACIPYKTYEFSSGGLAGHSKTTSPAWYHTNRAEIYYNFSNNGDI